jgi:site-specific DNA-methyltransferase (adenine-specific)
MNKYNIIYADPPWKYNSRNNINTRFGGGVFNKYSLMTMEEIKSLPISNLAEENCVLFLWCTFPYLDEQIKLFDYWGFRYRTLGFSWIKTNSKNGKPFFGVGYYAKSNCEICLMGMKGQLKPISNKVSSVIISPRREHSKKPDEVRNKIVELFGDLPRIELFAREKVEGWASWGNEIESDVEIEGYSQKTEKYSV